MPGRKFVSGEDYRFGFNGKEDDRDWGTQNIQDYGFRLYNPSIGKFLSVDPLAPEYPELTCYQFASNTPIQAIDLDGLEAFFVHGTTNFDLAWMNFQTGAYYFKSYDKVVQELPKAFGNQFSSTAFRWSGDNTDKARAQAGRDLANYVMSNRVSSEPITLVGHSHGGNAVIEAALILINDHKIDPNEINIVTMNTSDQWEQTLPQESDMNVYSINAISDQIQELGSDFGGFDDNGIVIDNADAYIFFTD